jgi:hypothetical protein
MHVRTDGRTNEESRSADSKLTTESRASSDKESAKCLDCGERTPKHRGVCHRCYERRRAAGTRDELPRKNYRHEPEACGICDEVAALHAHGWDAHTIVTAIGLHPEYVARHVKRWTPHLLPLVIDAARASANERSRKP